jgi:hypothetical protein
MRFALLLPSSLALAQLPDRPPRPDEWGYRPPDGATVPLNPPPLSWVHEATAVSYELEWAGNPEFRNSTRVNGIPWSVYTHHSPLAPGKYWWRYRIIGKDGKPSPWSQARSFTVPADAVPFPQPTLEELKRRVPKDHPRLFVTSKDLPRLREWARGGGRAAWEQLVARAEQLHNAEPTPEPAVRASASDPATRQFWWSNREQTIRALQEAEILSFAWLLTRDPRYGDAARRFTLKLAAWDPDGPTNFQLNCEAAKPMLHRLARAYDWAWPLFSEQERARIRAVLLRRALDAWNSGEVRQGAGHLNQPYNSHGNRTWHKLAENAIATLGETPESDRFLEYAVTKFFAAYPVWSDDDGGWHEGLAYFAGYMSKIAWWMEVARVALGIDGFKKTVLRSLRRLCALFGAAGFARPGLRRPFPQPSRAGLEFHALLCATNWQPVLGLVAASLGHPGGCGRAGARFLVVRQPAGQSPSASGFAPFEGLPRHRHRCAQYDADQRRRERATAFQVQPDGTLESWAGSPQFLHAQRLRRAAAG